MRVHFRKRLSLELVNQVNAAVVQQMLGVESADIHYPTDLGLLNAARAASEAILDALYQQVSREFKTKPRT